VNTLAIRSNLASLNVPAGQPSPSFVSVASDAIKADGFGSLYKGLGAGLWRQLFYATSRLGLFEVYRDWLSKYRETDFFSRLITASAAGGCAAMISCPCEVSLVRMSNDLSLPAEKRRNYSGVVDCMKRIAGEEGVPAFWRGCGPFVARACMVGGTQVATYDQFKKTYSDLGLKGLSNTVVSSFSAGLVYSIATMPLESAKNRMAFQQPDPTTGKLPYSSLFQTISSVAKTSGPLQLFDGFVPYYLRCGGHTVLMFVFVEQIKATYHSQAATRTSSQIVHPR
jgi:solute carrier family 25 oxoglutarate transporter 11